MTRTTKTGTTPTHSEVLLLTSGRCSHHSIARLRFRQPDRLVSCRWAIRAVRRLKHIRQATDTSRMNEREFAGRPERAGQDGIVVRLPSELPELTPAVCRALLAILVELTVDARQGEAIATDHTSRSSP